MQTPIINRISSIVAIVLTSLVLQACNLAESVRPSAHTLNQSFALAGDSQMPVTISTNKGLIEGIAQESTYAFLGVPFAKPPVGTLRWQPPKPMDAWEGIKSTKAFAQPCMPLSDTDTGSEDCLYLNIWTPKNFQPDSNYAVLFFIHGGSYEQGSASDKILNAHMYEGRYLSEQNIVVVTIDYRIGAMGFLAHPLLAESHEGDSGNYGTKDMIAALEWTRQNIRAFGGSPEKITIMGESAGAWGVCSLVLAPQAKGLFRSAIMESGPCVEQSPQRAHRTADQLMEALNCHDADCLKAKSAKEVSEAFATLKDAQTKEQSNLLALNIYGTDVRPLPVLEAFRSGEYNQVPMIIGTNKSEWILPAKTDESMTCGVYKLSQTLAATQSEPVFRYQFSHKPLGFVPAAHGVELPFIFGTAVDMVQKHRPEDLAAIDVMQSYWLQFIKTQNVNKFGQATWLRDSNFRPKYMDLNAKPEQKQGSAIIRNDVCSDDFISVPDSK